MKKQLLLVSALLVGIAPALRAQSLKDKYITWGVDASKLSQTLTTWDTSNAVNEDDNFFISRIKPRVPFRNAATQVKPNLTAENDKRLVAWMPIGDPGTNGLPNGVFDSEVFNMWSYVDHWGNWSAPQGRVPGAFLDVAHKNGVAVSAVASVPFGGISSDWQNELTAFSSLNVDLIAKFLTYYGIDGLGYNSEWSGARAAVQRLQTLHESLTEKMKSQYGNPIFENMWYDGTNDNGVINFDRGLAAHNDDNFGLTKERASLFFNYNWNTGNLLANSVSYAKANNRNPLYLYAGFNLQGGEPSSGTRWPLLAEHNISIGLWGAHDRNMWWESRGEKGSSPEVKQNAYMARIERWFGGGKRNPVITPALSNSLQYNADNFDFHGMAAMMSARSALSWNLAEEPFISYFNLGNGRFFNWQGQRQNNIEWYNIGVQDHLPTWRWWFTKSLLGRTADQVVANGLQADFTWDDAYMGGSCLRIQGTSAEEYLHLFKTKYALAAGDAITLRYKLAKGQTALRLALTAEGNEGVALGADKYVVTTAATAADDEHWQTATFTVGEELAGKTLALVALHFENASNLDLRLGEFSIVRQSAATPAQPEIISSQLLALNSQGADGKLIFKMPNDKPKGTPCYNIDVNTSMFKLYAQQEGKEPVFMGVTTSWAGMFYQIPLTLQATATKVRLGVSALSLDHRSESAITWTDYQSTPAYKFSDEIQISKTTIKPNEAFEMGYADQLHEEGTWELVNADGQSVFTGTGNKVSMAGLPNVGSYTLRLTGLQTASDGTRSTTTREFPAFVQITPESLGALPEIYTLTANGGTNPVEVNLNTNVAMAYTARPADGQASQGVQLDEKRFGAKAGDLGVTGGKSYSVAFWLKIDQLAPGATQLLSVADKNNAWPKTDWGWLWTTINEDGTMGTYTFRGTDMSSNNELRYVFGNTKLPVGNWVHLAFVFDYNGSGGFRSDFYVNGLKQEVTKWYRSAGGGDKTTQPGYESNVYGITAGQMIAVGGNAFGRNGFNGAVDNFQIWDKALTADEVKVSMSDVDANNLPSGLAAFWPLETRTTTNNFASVGPKSGVAAGLHSYVKSGGEGQGTLLWEQPIYTAGSPFVTGTGYAVTTTPTWKARYANVTDATGNDRAGSANVAFAKSGDYDVTLTLTNAYGAASKTFSVIKVNSVTSIGSAQVDDISTTVVGENVLIDFASAGDYTVQVYSLAGQQLANRAVSISAGSNVQIGLAQPGTYVLRIFQGGRVVKSAKLLRQ